MDENSQKIDLFRSEKFAEIIAEKMSTLDELKNRLPSKDNVDGLKFIDKSFFKRVLNDITDIYIEGNTLVIHFGRGVDMYIEGSSPDANVYNEKILRPIYRTYKILGELIDKGEMKLKTSPFTIFLSNDNLHAEYVKSLDEKMWNLPETANSHDRGINCWGGWSGPIRYNYDNLNIEESLFIMIQRMKQLNIDDYAGNLDRMTSLIKCAYKLQPLKVNPVTLASLIVEYDLQDFVIDGYTDDRNFFRRDIDGNLTILSDSIKTDISYDIFVRLLREVSKNYKGDKPKIKRREKDIS